MSLLNYFKRKDGLPNPRGTLSAVLPSKSIASANRAVKEELRRISKITTRGPYRKLVKLFRWTLVYICSCIFVLQVRCEDTC